MIIMIIDWFIIRKFVTIITITTDKALVFKTIFICIYYFLKVASIGKRVAFININLKYN